MSVRRGFTVVPVGKISKKHNFFDKCSRYLGSLCTSSLHSGAAQGAKFSGKAVTYFVWIAQQDPSLDSILRHHSDERNLFNTSLYLTTGWDLDGRRGDHASRDRTDHQRKLGHP